MKKEIAQIEYSLKGLCGVEDNTIIAEVEKKDEVIKDEINLKTLQIDIINFCEKNTGKNVEFKVMVKVCEEE